MRIQGPINSPLQVPPIQNPYALIPFNENDLSGYYAWSIPHLDPMIKIEIGVSNDFVWKLNRELERVPPNIRHLLKSKGYTIFICRRLVDSYPALRYKKLYGRENESCDNLIGLHSGINILVAEEYIDRDSNELRKNPRPRETLRHEIGHAVDENSTSERLSSTNGFQKAHKLCLDYMFGKNHYSSTACYQENLRFAFKQRCHLPSYYIDRIPAICLRSNEFGFEEAFAEVFAAIINENPGVKKLDEYSEIIKISFPFVSGFIRNCLASISA